jgi:beta-lactamase regulating signal transducer with metallopeptidase domain
MTLANVAWVYLQAIARASTGRMLNCISEGILVALFAWIVVRWVGRQNSGTRFAVWYVSLLAIAGLPALSLVKLVPLTHSASRIAGSRSAITLPSSWAVGLWLVWAVIAGVGLTKILFGLWQLRRLRRSCVEVDAASFDPRLRKTLESFRAARHVKLLTSDRLSVPAAIGFFRPAVVIPAWSLRELSLEELNAVLLHELAHLRRWDDWTNLIQKLLRAFFFFHPAVWLVEGRLSLEREMACDDVVLAATSSPRAYAACLVSLAEKSFLHRGFILAQAAVSRMRQTQLRVLQILEENRPRTTGVWKPAIGFWAAFSVVALVSASRVPDLVTFRDSGPKAGSASAVQPSDAPPVAFPARLQQVAASYEVPGKRGMRAAKARPNMPIASTTPVRDRFLARTVISREEVSSEPPILASFELRSSRPQPVQLVALRATTTPVAPTEAVFVVMEGYGESGSTYWTLCVWRVSVITSRSADTGSNAGVPAKSI